MKKKLVILLVSLFAFGCTTTPDIIPQKTQLQIREFQTKTYNTNETKMILKAMLNVLQDDGFVVKNAEVELGLLTAIKEVDIESKHKKFSKPFEQLFLIMFTFGAYRPTPSWEKSLITEATVNVSEFGEQSRVRVTFQVTMKDNEGNTLQVRQVEDAAYYQNFFSKVDKGIFIQKQKIS